MYTLASATTLAWMLAAGDCSSTLQQTTPVSPPAPGSVAQPATPIPPPTDTARAEAAKLQTLLARSGFSPGLIDGKPGRKTKIALEHFQRAKGLEVTGTPDEQTLAALSPPHTPAPTWTRPYHITDADLALITGPIPTDWNERATLELSGYENTRDLLAERGWCASDLLDFLNPGMTFTEMKPGDEVILPDVPDASAPKTKGLAPIAHLKIHLNEKLILGFDAAGNEIALFHCSIARLAEKRPIGNLHVQVLVTDPDYTFDPHDWPEVDNVASKLRIAPGPRNPVGLAWIGLDKPGYGVHGTVRPQDIGKTGSHGCFRMANWDAVRLVKVVKIGTVVEVKE